MLQIIPSETTLEATDHPLIKKENCVKLAQLQGPLLLFETADHVQHSFLLPVS